MLKLLDADVGCKNFSGYKFSYIIFRKNVLNEVKVSKTAKKSHF